MSQNKGNVMTDGKCETWTECPVCYPDPPENEQGRYKPIPGQGIATAQETGDWDASAPSFRPNAPSLNFLSGRIDGLSKRMDAAVRRLDAQGLVLGALDTAIAENYKDVYEDIADLNRLVARQGKLIEALFDALLAGGVIKLEIADAHSEAA